MNQSMKYYMHCLIGFLLMVVFWFMAPIGPVTELGMKVLGVFLGTMYLWTFVETVWPSLIGVVMLGLTGFNSFNGIIASTFGSPLVIMLFFVIILTGAITEEGICEYIARWFITRKINNGRPWVFTTMFLLGVYILAIMTAPSPTIFIFWPILYSMFAVLGYKEGDKYATLMLVAVVLVASFGFATTPFKGALPGLLGNFTKVTGMEVEYLPYMAVAMAISIVGILVIVGLMKFVFKPDTTKLQEVNTEIFNKNPLPKMNSRQKSLVGALLFFVAWVLSPSVIPAGPAQQFVKDTQNIIPVFIIAICCFVRLEKKPLVDFRGIVSKYMLWPVILIVASALTIGNALTAESTGITELLKQMVTPLFEGQSPIMFMILIITLACILTNVCNNMVVGMLLVPIIHVFSQEMGINPIPVAILSLFLVCVAIVTPAASTTSAILHGNTKWISTKEAYKYGIIMTIVTLLITLMIGLPLANIIF